MAGIFEHLHLKGNTAGSSNELSLDVLDAARKGLDDKKKTEPLNPKALKGSYHGVTGTSTLSSNAEVEKHKKARARKNRRAVVVGASLTLVAVGAIIFVVLGYVRSTGDYRAQISEQIAASRQYDSLLVPLDAIMSDPYGRESQDSAAEALAQENEAKGSFANVTENVQALEARALAERDADAIAQVEQGVSTREALFDYAHETLEIVQQVEKLVEQMNSLWNGVLDADQTAREATDLANSATTEEQTRAARETTKQALDQMSRSYESLGEFNTRYSEVDIAAQLAYLNKRIEALQHAVSTSDALLSGDRELARSENDLYNESDQIAADMAQQLPASIEESARKGFSQQVEKLQANYASERNRLSEIDKTLDNYR